jgi:hypothetical protein
MAKKAESGDEAKKGAERYTTKEPLNMMIRKDIRRALKTYVDGTSPPVKIVSAVETALIEFLTRQGKWPPPAEAAPAGSEAEKPKKKPGK